MSLDGTLQLAEVRLFDGRGQLDVRVSSNPRSMHNNHRESSAAAHDDNVAAKWVDQNATHGNATRSVLSLTLDEAVQLARYEFVTANDAPWRDPVSWSLVRQTPGGSRCFVEGATVDHVKVTSSPTSARVALSSRQ